MNKILVIVSLSVLLLACKTGSKTTNLSPDSNRNIQSSIKGNWQITHVSYPGSDYIKVNSFQIADSKCFIGSTWNFIPNNNKGSLSLGQTANCSSFSSPIVWSIDKEGNFGLKIVEAGVKSKKVVQGYLLKISNITETSFQLIDMINAGGTGGQKKEISYQFEKIN